ncbi:MAG: hypothetical protein VKL59_05910 [Nostocaceae cyanobacterium]|nr:hypothetical protein [Nostocaceae cyanobacterium]
MRFKKLPLVLSIFVLVLSCCVSFKGDAQTPRTINSLSTIINDMKPPHQGIPHGVPRSYGWADGPRIAMGNNPDGYKAMTAWGQLYEDAQGNFATNTRVEIRNIKAYMLSKRDGQWHLVQSSRRVEGGAFREDFRDNITKPADIRYEPDGNISVKAGKGYNFHFWPVTNRAIINPDEVEAIFTTVEARLIVDNPQQWDDCSQARYLLSMGGDYWLNSAAQWDYWQTNGDIAIGKFKYVTTKWQAFNMTTLSINQILRNPPPIE